MLNRIFYEISLTRILIALSILLVVIVIVICLVWLRSVDVEVFPCEQISVDGAARSYRLVVPHTLPHPAPIVFAFHGIGDSTETMADYSHLDQLALAKGFILVYPAARNGMWKTTDVGPEMPDTNLDVRFFDRLLDHLSDRYDVDRDRVYVVGMSNGGTFVQLLTAARSDKIAAVVAHSGSKPDGLGSPERRFPIMLLVGADDPVSSAMQSDADQYRAGGHVVQFVSIPKLAHEWATRYNSEIGDFLSQNPLDR